MEQRVPIPNSADVKQPRRSLKSYLIERAQSEMEVIGISAITSLEYLSSMNLEADFMHYVQRKKSLLGDYIYVFRIDLRDFKSQERILTWTLRRRYSDFVILCKEINKELEKAKMNLKSPYPPLQCPKGNNKQHFLETLELFLNNLLKNKELRENSQALYDFLETSLLPLPEGPKVYKEGYLLKRAGGRYSESRLQTYSGLLCKRWLKRWFIVSEEGLLYTVDSNSNQIREMLLFDQSFRIEYGRKLTGSKLGITIITPTRKLNLRASNFFQTMDWISSIQQAVDKCLYVKINRFFSFAPIRNPTSYCKAYVDGEDYFSDVCDALLKATKEVFIAGWWVSPELYLKRPVQAGNVETRLDRILKQIADRGVKIYILLYREVKLALYNDSAYSKLALQALSPNIRVLRHPKEFLFLWSHHEKLVIIDHHVAFLGGLDLCYGRMDINSHPLIDPTFHENGIEMFPGIDYSNPRIVDFRNVRVHHTALIDKNVTPRLPWHDVAMMVIGEPTKDLTRHFIQCWNFAQIDMKGKGNYFITPKVSTKSPSASKTKLSFDKLKLRVKGMLKMGSPKSPNIRNSDAALSQIDKDKRFDLYVQTKVNNLPVSLSDVDMNDEEQKERDIDTKRYLKIHRVEETAIKEERKFKQFNSLVVNAKKNNNTVLKAITSPPHLIIQPPGDKFPLQLTPSKEDKALSNSKNLAPQGPEILITEYKTSILEIGALKEPNYIRPIKLDFQANKDFNNEYASLLKKCREKEIVFEKSYGSRTPQARQSTVFSFDEDEINKEKPEKINDHFFEENMLQPLWKRRDSTFGSCICQVIRSASSWSLGLNADEKYLENSIQNAYIEIIQSAKSFIYIENQFFISGTAGDPVGNQIAQALVLRIEKAYQLNENFRVVVFLPLLPAFEGEVDDPKATVLRIQLHWQYQTISRGPRSIYNQLIEKGISDPTQYIEFYSLRQHAKLQGVPVTEMIYIHTKLMIVDDDIVIMGSANINDRSMQGSRDSEIAMVIEDSKKVESVIDSQTVNLGEFAHKLRKQLWMEHLNLSEEEVRDPLNLQLTGKMNEMAQTNTQIYREVFGCYPDDNIQRLNEVKEFRKQADLSKYESLSLEIKSHIVQFPLQFLSRENLTFSVTHKEYYVPEISFT